MNKFKAFCSKVKQFLTENCKLILNLVLFGLAFINIALQIIGLPPLKIDGSTLPQNIADFLSGLIFIFSFWTNNNFTQSAKEAQKVLDVLKEEKRINRLEEKEANIK